MTAATTRSVTPGQGFPKRHVEFLSDPANDALWTERQRGVRRQATEVAEAKGLAVLLGPRGTGKTLIATVVAHNYRAGGGCASARDFSRYWVLGDLFAAEKASWRDRDATSPLARARSQPLLVLDEVQESNDSAWEEQELTRLIDARYRECLPTILVANLKPEDLAGRLGSSIVSRMNETGAVFVCDWPSFRGGRA